MGRPRRMDLIPTTGDVPVEWAAIRMGFVNEATGRPDVEGFMAALPSLFAKGFPKPDPTTGKFDLDAIYAWRRTRNARLFTLTPPPTARDARNVAEERIQRTKQ